MKNTPTFFIGAAAYCRLVLTTQGKAHPRPNRKRN
jgi:hypothetical protein